MIKVASYILQSYSLLINLSIDKLLDIGNRSKNGQPIPSFDEKLLKDLCSETKEIFKKEDNLLEIEGDVIIVGDIHGSFHDLLRILHFVFEDNSKVLFLGDYVDRGNFSLECITILFALKILYPDSFYLIRGNHEFNSLCKQYGFKDEILNYHKPDKSTNSTNIRKKLKQKIPKFCKVETFSEQSENSNETECYQYTESLYNSFIDTFSYLPIGAIVNKTTFCVHGGLSPNLNDINDLNMLINRPIQLFKESSILTDVLWSDPQENLNCLFTENPRGHGYSFNEKAVKKFLKNTSLTRIVRGHQCVKRGVLKNFDDKCITVFSASSFDKKFDNCSSVIKLFQKDDKVKVTTFLPIKQLQKDEVIRYKVPLLNQNCHDSLQ